MILAESRLHDRERSLVQRPRPEVVAVLLREAGEVVDARRHLDALGPREPLADRERALVRRPGLLDPAQRLLEPSEGVQDLRHIEAVLALRPLANRESAFEDAPCGVVLAEILEHQAVTVERDGEVRGSWPGAAS